MNLLDHLKNHTKFRDGNNKKLHWGVESTSPLASCKTEMPGPRLGNINHYILDIKIQSLILHNSLMFEGPTQLMYVTQEEK